MALRSLLISSFGKSGAGALNLTDGLAFPWIRLLKNATQCKECVGPGIQRVYAARHSEGGAAMLLLRRYDGSYVDLCPHMRKNWVEITEGKWVEWKKLEILKDATRINLMWIKSQEQPGVVAVALQNLRG